MPLKCAFCGRKADAYDVKYAKLNHNPFHDWYCQKSCYEGAGEPYNWLFVNE